MLLKQIAILIISLVIAIPLLFFAACVSDNSDDEEKTKETVDMLVKIDAAGGFGSLNVSNAAAIALYASQPH